MVQGVSSGGNVGVIAITAMRYAQSDGHDVVMPVRRSQMVYANFKHIQVLPESRLQDGVPLYKLKILDTLIDELSKKGVKEISGWGGASGPAAGASGMKSGDVDALIAGMSRELRASASSYRTGFLPEPGAFVDLVA